jgi:hypothetical protein
MGPCPLLLISFRVKTNAFSVEHEKLEWTLCDTGSHQIQCTQCQLRRLTLCTCTSTVLEVRRAWFFWAWVGLELYTSGLGFFRLEKFT